MSSNFKVGSISNIVNSSPNKKNKKLNKKQKSPKPQETHVISNDVDVKEELPEQKKPDTKRVGLKRKTSESEKSETIEVIKTETPGKKKEKRMRKGKPAAETESTIPMEETNEQEPKKVNSNSNKKADDSNQEKLSRTIFVGNLPAGFSVKVFCICSIV